MTRDYPLLIGACGWFHAGWLDDYYPHDLPADWRLSYYANEFPVVLVAEAEWCLPEVNAAHWCEETEASFRFVLEMAVTEVEQLQNYLSKVAAFEDRCAGILLCVSGNIEITSLGNILDKVTTFAPVCVDFGNQDIADNVIQVLKQKQISRCWHGEGAPEGLSLGAFAVTRIVTDDTNPRQIRHWVENCLKAGDTQRQTILLFDGNPPSIEVIRQAQIILDLL